MKTEIVHEAEIVETADVDRQVQPVENGLAVWDGLPSRFVSNFDGDDREQFKQRLACISAGGGGDPVGQEIDVRYWFIHEVKFIDKDTGEPVNTWRTVLVDPKGKMLAVVSVGVARAVKLLHQQFGAKPIDPPIRMKVVRTKTGSGRQFYQLVPV